MRIKSGGHLQAGIPCVENRPSVSSQIPALVRGVVTATYVTDDPEHPYITSSPAGVYCDVLCYTGGIGGRYWMLRAVAVSQDIAGMHKGTLCKPKAATRSIDGQPISDLTAVDPQALDGDHVLVAFIEGSHNQPVILRALPHPSLDAGNNPALPAGARQRLRLSDGDPHFIKHHGSVFGVADNGDFVIDTSRANGGASSPAGAEVPGVGGQNGAQSARLPTGAARVTTFVAGSDVAQATTTKEVLAEDGYQLNTLSFDALFSVLCAQGNTMTAKHGGPLAELQVGDGAFHVALAEALANWWNTHVKAYLDSHIHPTGVGPSAPPTVPSPSYDPAITSAKVSVPNQGGA